MYSRRYFPLFYQRRSFTHHDEGKWYTGARAANFDEHPRIHEMKKNTRHWQVADWKRFWWITGTVVERKIRRFGVSYDREKKRTWEIKNHESAPVKARRARSGRTSGRRRCNKWQTRGSTLLVRVVATLPDGATARPKPNTKFNGTRLLPPFPSSFRNSFRPDGKRRFTKVSQHLYTHLYEYIISVVRNTSKFHWYGYARNSITK